MLNINELVSTLHYEMKDKLKLGPPKVSRQADFSSNLDKIKVAIGMRRSGKTSLMFQKMHMLLSEDIAINRILYINFEDERLPQLDAKTLGLLLDAFYTLYPENHDLECYIFLDEIQNVENWALVIRRFFDSKKIQIYLTGSSAKLLSKEIATELRGRSIATEIFPFSFEEYLIAKNVVSFKATLSRPLLDQRRQLLMAYLEIGGFPEVISLEVTDRFRILQDYVDVVIFRDIIERYHITNIALIKYLIKTLLSHSGRGFSVTKLYHDLKSQGFSVGRATIYEYLTYLEDVYLAFSVPLYSESLRKTQSNPRKVYAVDTGLIHACTMSFSNNWGRLFENLIYLDLRRKGHEIYYYLTKERYEVDFFTRSREGKLALYQVCWDDNEIAIEREMRALNAAQKELNVPGKLITLSSYFSEPL